MKLTTRYDISQIPYAKTYGYLWYFTDTIWLEGWRAGFFAEDNEMKSFAITHCGVIWVSEFWILNVEEMIVHAMFTVSWQWSAPWMGIRSYRKEMRTGCDLALKFADSYMWHAVLPKLQSTKPLQIGFFTHGKGLQSSPIFIKNLYAQFPKFGCFSTVKCSKSPNWAERQLDCWLLHEEENRYWLLSRESLGLLILEIDE